MKRFISKLKKFFHRKPKVFFISPPQTQMTQDELLSFFNSKQWYWLFEQLSLVEEATIEDFVEEGPTNARELLYLIRYI